MHFLASDFSNTVNIFRQSSNHLMFHKLLVKSSKIFLRIILTRMVETPFKKFVHLFITVLPKTQRKELISHLNELAPPKKIRTQNILKTCATQYIRLLILLLPTEKNETLKSQRRIKPDWPFINSASKSPANHVSKFCISHFTPSITKNSEVLHYKSYTTCELVIINELHFLGLKQIRNGYKTLGRKPS